MARADRQAAPPPRSVRLDTRVTVDDAALIRRAAARADLTPSALVRGAAVDRARTLLNLDHAATGATAAMPPTLTPEDRRLLDAARVALIRVGVNVNQIARAVHRGEVTRGETLAPRLDELGRLYRQLVTRLGGSVR